MSSAGFPQTPPPPPQSPAEPLRPGLRQRKKARTRASIQSHALALFVERGYEATTVQEIADAAEVSESTFFRYFPTKADVVMWDDFDPVIIEAYRRQPPELEPMQAVRAAFRDAFAQLSETQLADQRARAQLGFGVPELRARMLDELVLAIGTVAALAAERTHRSTDDVEVRAFAGAVIGAALAASAALIEDPHSDFAAVLDSALAALQNGLRFED